MKILLLIIAMFVGSSLAGCSILQGAATQVANGVVKYCAEPEAARLLIRQNINTQLAPHGHVMHVHCKGDADSPLE